MFYVPVREKNCGADFRNFALKMFGEFFKFRIETCSVEHHK